MTASALQRKLLAPWVVFLAAGAAGLALPSSQALAQPAETLSSAPTAPAPLAVKTPTGQEANAQQGLISGNKPFSLVTDDTGEIIIRMSERNEPEGLIAKKGVIFSSEDLTLNCDQLDFDYAKNEVVATGRRVIVRQGEIIVTCKVFKYFASDQRSEFTGEPIVYNRGADGKTTNMSGEEITIYMVNNKPQIRVRGMNKRAPGLSQGGVTVGATPPAGTSGVAPGPARTANVTLSDPAPISGSAMRSGQSVPPTPVPTPAPGPGGAAGAGRPAPSLLGGLQGGSGGGAAAPRAPKGDARPLNPDNPADAQSLARRP